MAQQRNLRITDHDWQLITDYAAAANMTPQAWLINVLVGAWMQAQGHEWDGVKAVGNPNWTKADSARCRCTPGRYAAGSIRCEICGLDVFE